MKRIFKAAFCAVLCGALAGCSAGKSVFGSDVEELLRAPRFSGQYNLVQDALDAYLGGTPQLKYPADGAYQSPFLFGDWDGDGNEDAAVLYTSSAKGQNVQLAVLEKLNGNWTVVQEREGLSAGVDSATTAKLEPDSGKTQLIIGYASPQGDKYLAVYRYDQRTLSTVLETDYDKYLAADLTGGGGEDIMVVKSNGESIELQLLTSQGDEYYMAQSRLVSQGRFTACANLTAGTGRDGRPTLIVDGYTGSGGTNMASEILYYDAMKGSLEELENRAADEIYNLTLRNLLFLQSGDINRDGTIEVPVQYTGTAAGEISPSLDLRTFFVGWVDFTRGNTPRSFGVVDAEYGFYLQLPSLWRGRISVTPGLTDKYWEVRSLDGSELYLTLRIADAGANTAGDYQRAALLGRQQIQLRITDAGRSHGFNSVKNCITVF